MRNKLLIKAVLVLAITMLAFALRVVRVAQDPPGLSPDEAALGWDAFAVLHSGPGLDQTLAGYGNFSSSGASPSALVIYLTVPGVFLLGLNNLAVRLPSVLAGTFTVLLSFILVEQILGASRPSIAPGNAAAGRILPPLTAFLLAISPWHIQVSRAAYPETIALFFMLAGAALLLSARTNPRRYLLAWLPFTAAIYTLNSEGVFAVLLGALVSGFTFSSVRKNVRLFGFGLAVASLLVIPAIPQWLSKDAQARVQNTSLFAGGPAIPVTAQAVAQDPDFLAAVFKNPGIALAREYLIHFAEYLQPDFLFVRGDPDPRLSTQDTGQMYLFEAPLLLAGFYYLYRRWRGVALLGSLWIVCAILPAAALLRSPSGLASVFTLPFWQVFIAAGIFYGLSFLNGKVKLLGAAALAGLYLFSLGYFLNNYLVHYPIEFSKAWQYGYKEAIQYAEAKKDSYAGIEFADASGNAALYALFYGRYSPDLLWETAALAVDESASSFGPYLITSRYTPQEGKSVLYIAPPDQVPERARILKTISFLNGKPAWVIFEPG